MQRVDTVYSDRYVATAPTRLHIAHGTESPLPIACYNNGMSQLFRRKSIADCENDLSERGGLRRSLNKWHLTALGVGATIGAGVFVTTGTAIAGDAVRPGAGPAIILACTFFFTVSLLVSPGRGLLARLWRQRRNPGTREPGTRHPGADERGAREPGSGI